MQKRCTEELSGGKKRKEPKKRRFGSTSIAELNQDISELAWAALREGSMPRRQQRGARNQIVWVMRRRCDGGVHTNLKRRTHALEKRRTQPCCCCCLGGGGGGVRLLPRRSIASWWGCRLATRVRLNAHPDCGGTLITEIVPKISSYIYSNRTRTGSAYRRPKVSVSAILPKVGVTSALRRAEGGR